MVFSGLLVTALSTGGIIGISALISAATAGTAVGVGLYCHNHKDEWKAKKENKKPAKAEEAKEQA